MSGVLGGMNVAKGGKSTSSLVRGDGRKFLTKMNLFWTYSLEVNTVQFFSLFLVRNGLIFTPKPRDEPMSDLRLGPPDTVVVGRGGREGGAAKGRSG